MGNHATGQSMGLVAELVLKDRKPTDKALDLLDRICERHRGSDAEFEAVDPVNPNQVHPDFDSYTDPHPGAALGMLMIEAFAPNGLADLARYAPMLDPDNPREETAYEAWHKEVYAPFQSRYSFC